MAIKTKYPMVSAVSGCKTYDEFHLTEEQMLQYVQEFFAQAFEVATARVKMEPSGVNSCSICVRVDRSPDIERIRWKGDEK